MRISLFTLVSLVAFGGCTVKSDDDTDAPTDTADADADTDTDTDSDADADADSDADADADSDTDTDPDADFSVTITAPAEGEIVASAFVLSFDVAGFALESDDIDGAAEDGHGHVHVYLDGAYYDLTPDTYYAFAGLDEGEHSVEVRLANNDHVELAVSDSVTVSVEDDGTPLVVITDPAFGATLAGSSVELGVLIDNFELSEDIGGAHSDGEGHYHVYVDGGYVDYDNDPESTLISQLLPGDHDLSIVLANNDHTEISPQISDTISVTVPDGAPAAMIMAPGNYDVIDSASYPLSVVTDNFDLNPDAIGGDAVDGEGHYHVYVDETYVGAYGESDIWLLHQTPGLHELEIRLADNEHNEIGVADSVRVSSPSDRPDITVTSPPAGEIVTSDFTVSVEIENFDLDADHVGGDVEEGVGHWHAFLDDAYVGFSAEGSISVNGASVGGHTLRVELYNNDHTELDQRVFDEIAVEVR